MKNGKNLLYLLIIAIIGLGAIMFFKKTPNAVVNEQSMLGIPTGTTLTDLQSQVANGFNTMDAAGLAQLCDEEIQFTHGETDDFFAKEDVESYFREFFKALPTKKFSVIHSGSNQAETGYYLIGNLETTNDKKMRIQISNNKKTIQSIEINDQREF